MGCSSEYFTTNRERRSRVSVPFWVRVGVRVGVRGWLGLAPVPSFHQEANMPGDTPFFRETCAVNRVRQSVPHKNLLVPYNI